MLEAVAEKKPQALLKPDQVADLLGISLRKVWQLRDAGEFPAPVRIGKRSLRWREKEVAEYIESLRAEEVSPGRRSMSDALQRPSRF